MEPLPQSDGNARAATWALAAVVLVSVGGVIGSIGTAGPVRTRLLTALFVTAAFAFLAFTMRAVDRGGAFAGAAVSYTLYAAAGPGAFAVLVSVFLLAFIGTRVGYARKQRLGKTESRRGRSAAQVLANLAAAAVLIGISPFVGYHDILLIAGAAALGEAAGDTVASECGEAWTDRVRLITTWKLVPPGTDGGISTPGTLASALAAVLVAGVCAAVQMISVSALPIVAGAAVVGVFFDSLLGATLQRRGFVGNDAVNVAGTIFAALVALAVAAL